MLAQIRKARQEESGFTLIELLIVIVILGILAGIVVFAVGGITDTGQTAACQADYRTVASAEAAFYATNADGGAAEFTNVLQDLVDGGFLQSAPATVAVTLVAGPPQNFTLAGAGECAGIPLA